MLSSSESNLVVKTVAMCILFCTSMIIGSIPMILSRLLRRKNWQNPSSNYHETCINLLLCFGGGVLLCTTFLHILPEVSDKINELKSLPDHLGETLMCIGFFFMYFIEEVIQTFVVNRRQSWTHNNNTKLEVTSEIGHDHQHTHHFESDSSSTVKTLRGLLIVLALSIHGLFEGLAVGLETSPKSMWYLFGAVSVHKLVISFCIGVELLASGMRNTLIIVYLFMFSIVSPLGIGSGILVNLYQKSEKIDQDGNELTMGLPSLILQGLAAGTLLYVVFFEILDSSKRKGMRCFLAILIGFLLMFGITYIG